MNFQSLFDASPNPYLVLDRRLHIAGANRAYLASVKRELPDIAGRWAWDAFPADAETVRQAVASFERVIRTRQTDTMALLRFDVPRPALDGGGFMERYWSITHSGVVRLAAPAEPWQAFGHGACSQPIPRLPLPCRGDPACGVAVSLLQLEPARR